MSIKVRVRLEQGRVKDADGNTIALMLSSRTFTDDEIVAHGADIVAAVNNHVALLGALRKIKAYYETHGSPAFVSADCEAMADLAQEALKGVGE